MTQSTTGFPKRNAVFEHDKRREWGLGVLAWESSNKRAYVFENGQLRILVEPFYSMMREVERPVDEIEALLEAIKPELDAARAGFGDAPQSNRRETTPAVSFAAQLEAFRAAFPAGFEDPAWVEQNRGTGARSRLGAHRDPAIADAQRVLAASALEGKIASQSFRSIQEDLWTLLKRTDLVPAAEIAVLKGADPESHRALSLALMDFLHGKDDFGPRMGRFVLTVQQAGGKPPGWQLVTALPALLDPTEHVVVRPTIFRTQAKSMAPGSSLPKSPTAVSYHRCLLMAKQVFSRLVEHGEKPRDLLDVYDFIRITSRVKPAKAPPK